jgi:hypothetical protein
MKRFVSTALVVVLLLGLGTLAVLARGGGDILTPAGNVALAQPQTAAAPDAPAVVGKYNMLGVPLVVSSITNETSLAAYIQSNTGTTVGRILKWNPTLGGTGGYYSYDPADPESDTFPVLVGDAFWLLSVGTGSPVLSYVGDVPAEHSVTFNLIGSTPNCRYNMITVPLDKISITNETQLASDIGASDVGRILYWDPTLGGSGGYFSYDPTDPESDSFAVKIGYPYWVCMKTSKTWPLWP